MALSLLIDFLVTEHQSFHLKLQWTAHNPADGLKSYSLLFQ